MPRKVYWDACCFIGLISGEPEKVTDCTGVWKEAEAGDTVIYTSFFTFTEVIRTKCEGVTKPLPEASDVPIITALRQSWIRPILLDQRIAVAARKLLRGYPECKKPSDGIHLASALSANVDEFHTYDGSDLLGLDGKVLRADGKPQKICLPKKAPPLPPPVSNQKTLFPNGQSPDQAGA